MAKNWMERQKPEIREKITWIAYHRFEDFEKAGIYCEELIDYGKAQNDLALIGACYFYSGEMNYTRMNVSEALSQLEISLLYLENSDAPRMHANACVTLGCIHMQSFSYETAMDYFLRGIAIAEKHHYASTVGILNFNIAAIHIELKNYTDALECLRISWEHYALEEESPAFHLHCLISNRTLMAIAYLQLLDLEKAQECIREIQELMKKQSENAWDLGSFYQLMAIYSERIHDEEQLMDYLQKFQDVYKGSRNKSDLMSTAVSLLEDLCDRGRMEQLERLDSLFQELLLADTPPNLRMSLLKVRWNMLANKDSEEALSIVQDIFLTYDRLKAYENRTKNAAVHKLLHRNAIFQQAEEWMMMANNDTLTGLWNRRYFEALYQEKKEMAASQRIPIAVGIMDIDCFKQLNDNYGHLEGDNSLKVLASLLKKHTSDHLEFARYGGDEFLLLSVGLSEEELRQEMSRLFQELAEENIPHLYSLVASRVTISMGISFHKNAAQMNSSLADMISEADQLLYQVKKNGRNAFLLADTTVKVD